MADMGVATDPQGQEFLEAMGRRKEAAPALALLETAIKATAKGAIGKLRQRSRARCRTTSRTRRWSRLVVTGRTASPYGDVGRAADLRD
nr:hypothetical protein OG284_35725 [Streptomyces sp. NBC_01177]WSS73230.1 hypothetical protein OG491_35515 [Streptomyces sp. NBC_01175]